MQTRSWDAKDGQKKYRTEIVADRVQFGPRSGGSGGSQGGGGKGEASATAEAAGGAQPVDKMPGVDTIEYPSEEINPDDIPF